VSHRRRIAASSIMPPTYAGSPKTGIPKTRVNPTHDRRTAIQLFFGVSLVDHWDWLRATAHGRGHAASAIFSGTSPTLARLLS
jgi:hypothetical protein